MSRMSRTQAATCGLLVPAALALAMSADTSYRFLETALQITDETERMVLCGVAEAAIIALTVYAWATRTKGPAYLAYAAVLVQAIPAFTVSGSVGGPVRVVLGPVLLAVLLHLLLGLELRMSGQKSDGLLASALRELRERLVASLGIGRRGADSAAIARSRAADKAVDLADRVADAKNGSWRKRRLSARLAEQIDAARHGLSPEQAAKAEEAIVARVVRRKSVDSLAGIEVRHDWALSLVPSQTVPVDGDKGHRDTGTRPVPAPAVPAVSLSPEPAVPPVSRPKAAVSAAVSPARPAVRLHVDKTPEEIRVGRDMSRDNRPQQIVHVRDARVGVPEDMLTNLSAIVRFLMETGHSKDEIRSIVPTLPGQEFVNRDSLKKAIQRAEKALADAGQ